MVEETEVYEDYKIVFKKKKILMRPTGVVSMHIYISKNIGKIVE